jgi:glycosyltransferase involved in cell wall biosynthesis
MRIVVAHNRYKFAGGEDTVMHAEVAMLREHGHDVELLEADNSTIDGMVAKIAAAGSLFHSFASSRRMTKLVREFQPDVLHVHNWFPLLSPSIIDAAVAQGVPVVQTLHNFRMLCANGMLYREGRICQDCVGKAFPTDGVMHGCYTGSRLGSAVVAAAFSYHRLAHRWDGVSAFIALSEFQRTLLERGGVDAAKLVVKPNFVKDSGGAGDGKGGYALFVGRLIPEKGIRTVLDAWKSGAMRMPLKIMGDGPLADEVRRMSTTLARVQYLGQQTSAEVYAAMAEARFVICASECHEAFGLTIVEAYARGTPVLAPDLESVSELVRPGVTGMRFTPGDACDLAAKASLLMADDAAYREMRRRCRALYEERYTDRINYGLLMEIYIQACTSGVPRTAYEKETFA